MDWLRRSQNSNCLCLKPPLSLPRKGEGTMWYYRGLLSLHLPGPTLVVEGDVCEITFGHQETARLISPDHPGLDMNSN